MPDVSWNTPEMFQIEDRGYGRGVGHLITPNGRLIAIHHEQDDFANACIKEVYSQYLNNKPAQEQTQ